MHAEPVLCETERLLVRRFKAEDLGELYTLLSDPRVMEYLEPPYTYEQSEDFLRKAGLAEPPLVYAVEDRAGGFLGYVIHHSCGTDCVELGWVLKPAAWGMGYAGELTRGLLEADRGSYVWAMIECVPGQEATKAVARRSGFRFVGLEDGCEIYKRSLDERCKGESPCRR